MIHQTIQLPVHYAGTLHTNGTKPYLKTYLLENQEALNKNRKRALVLICPGGGYEYLSPREAEPIAIKMNSLGFQAAVLYYSIKPMDFPAAACDLAEAIYYARTHADEWNVNADQIILCGFSAGGHLCATLGCHWNSGLLSKYLTYKPADIKPNALLLSYPVITADKAFCHEGSITNVLGSVTGERETVSLENHVTKDMPPVFMWHTFEDQAVPAENTLRFAQALRKAGIKFEYHLFASGSHGLALSTNETSEKKPELEVPACAVWPELFKAWWDGNLA
ncbi:MAG: alpha/beta hydrolase [Treponema sp.]|nr:alpha/beta hydrolase [Treponema sp.]